MAPASILVAVNLVHKHKHPHTRQHIQKQSPLQGERAKKTNVKAATQLSPDEMTMRDIQTLMAPPAFHDSRNPKRKLKERKSYYSNNPSQQHIVRRHHHHRIRPITDHTNDTNDILTGLNMNEVQTRAQLSEYKDTDQIIDHIDQSDDVLNQYKESTYQSEIESIMRQPISSFIHKKTNTFSSPHLGRKRCPCAAKKSDGTDLLVELARCLCLPKVGHSRHHHKIRHGVHEKVEKEKHRTRRSNDVDSAEKRNSLKKNRRVEKARSQQEIRKFTKSKKKEESSDEKLRQKDIKKFGKAEKNTDSSIDTFEDEDVKKLTKSEKKKDPLTGKLEEEGKRRKEISHSRHHNHSHHQDEKIRLKAKGVSYRPQKTKKHSKKSNSKSKQVEVTGHTRGNQKERQYRVPPISLQSIAQHFADKMQFHNKPERPDAKSEGGEQNEDAAKAVEDVPAKNEESEPQPEKKENAEENEEKDESQKEEESSTEEETESPKAKEDEESPDEEEASQKEEVGKKENEEEGEEESEEKEERGKDETEEDSEEEGEEKEKEEQGEEEGKEEEGGEEEGKEEEEEEEEEQEAKHEKAPHRAFVHQPLKPVTAQQLNEQRQHLFSLFALAHKKKQEKIAKNLKKLQKDVKTDKDIQTFLAGEATDLEEEAEELHSKWRPLHHSPHAKSESVEDPRKEDPKKAKHDGVQKVNALLHRVHWWKKEEESQKEYHPRKSGQEVDALLQRHRSHNGQLPIDPDKPRLERLRNRMMNARKQKQQILKMEKKLHEELLMEAKRAKEKEELHRQMAEEKERERVRQAEEKARDQWFHEHVMKKSLSSDSNGNIGKKPVVSNVSASTRASIFHYRSHRRGNENEDMVAHRRTLDLRSPDTRAGVQLLSNSSDSRQQLDNIILSVLPALSREIDVSEHIIDRPFKDDMKYLAEQLDREEQNYVEGAPERALSLNLNNADKREHLSAGGQSVNLAVENRYIVPLIKEVVRGINTMSRSELSALTKNRIGRFKDEREYNKFIETQVKLLMEEGRKNLLTKKDSTIEPGKRHGGNNNNVDLMEELSAERMNNITVMVEEEIYRLIRMKQKELQIFTDEDEKLERETSEFMPEEKITTTVKSDVNSTDSKLNNSTGHNDEQVEYVKTEGHKDNSTTNINDKELVEFIKALPGKFNMTYRRNKTEHKFENLKNSTLRPSNNSAYHFKEHGNSTLLFTSLRNKTSNFGNVSDHIGSLFLPKEKNMTLLGNAALKDMSKFQVLNATIVKENDALLPTDEVSLDMPVSHIRNVEYTSKDEIHNTSEIQTINESAKTINESASNITQYINELSDLVDLQVNATEDVADFPNNSSTNVFRSDNHYGNASKDGAKLRNSSDNLKDFQLPLNMTVASMQNVMKDLKLPLETSTLNFTTKDMGNYILQPQSEKPQKAAKECKNDKTCFLPAKVEIDISLIPKNEGDGMTETKTGIYDKATRHMKDANLLANVSNANNIKTEKYQRTNMTQRIATAKTNHTSNIVPVNTKNNKGKMESKYSIASNQSNATSSNSTLQEKVLHKSKKIVMLSDKKSDNSNSQNASTDVPSKLSITPKDSKSKVEFDLTIDDASKYGEKVHSSLSRREETKKMVKTYKKKDTIKNDVPEYLNSSSRNPDKFLHRDVYMPHFDEGPTEGSGDETTNKDDFHTFFDKKEEKYDEKYGMSRKQKKNERRAEIQHEEKGLRASNVEEVVLMRKKRDEDSTLEPNNSNYNFSLDIDLNNASSSSALPHNNTMTTFPTNSVTSQVPSYNVTTKHKAHSKTKEVTVEVSVPLVKPPTESGSTSNGKNKHFRGHPANIPNLYTGVKSNTSVVVLPSNVTHRAVKKKKHHRRRHRRHHKKRSPCDRRNTMCDVKPIKTSLKGHLKNKLLIKAIATPCGKDRVNISAVIYSLCDRKKTNARSEKSSFRTTKRIVVNQTAVPDMQEGVYVVEGDLAHMLKRSSQASQILEDSQPAQVLDIPSRGKRYDPLAMLQKQLTASYVSNTSTSTAKETLKPSLTNSSSNSTASASVEDPVAKFTTYAKYIIASLNDTINSSPTSDATPSSESGKKDLLAAFFSDDTNRTAASAEKKSNDTHPTPSAAEMSSQLNSSLSQWDKLLHMNAPLTDPMSVGALNSSLISFLNGSLPKLASSNETEAAKDGDIAAAQQYSGTANLTREPLFNISSPLRLPSNSSSALTPDSQLDPKTVIAPQRDNITLLENEKYLKGLVRNLTLLANNYEKLTLREDSSATSVFQQLKEKVNSIQEQIGIEGGRIPQVVETEAAKRNV